MPNLKVIRRLRLPLPNVFNTSTSQFALSWTALNQTSENSIEFETNPRADAAHLNEPESHYEVHTVYPGGGSCCSRRLRRRSRTLDEHYSQPSIGHHYQQSGPGWLHRDRNFPKR